jgi:hypothetical protein
LKASEAEARPTPVEPGLLPHAAAPGGEIAKSSQRGLALASARWLTKALARAAGAEANTAPATLRR